MGTNFNIDAGAGSGVATIQNRSAGTQVYLGSTDTLTGSLRLGLSGSELGRVSAGDLTIRSNPLAAASTLTVAGSINLSSVNDLTLISDSTIDVFSSLELAGSGTLTLDAATNISGLTSIGVTSDKLLLKAGGTVNLPAVQNDVNTLAVDTNGSVTFVDEDNFTLGTVGSASGIDTDGVVSLTALAGTLDVSQALTTTSTSVNSVTMEADDISLGAVVTTSGGITIRPTDGESVGFNTGTGTLQLGDADLVMLTPGYSKLTVGGADAGTVEVGTITGLATDVAFQAGTSADLTVTGSVSWSSDRALTLSAGQDIWILNDIDVGGSAATLNLFYGGTNGSTVPTAGSNFYLDISERRTIDFAHLTANLKLGNETHTLLDSMSDFVGMSSSGRYALATDLDLSGTTFNDAVFTSTFTGKFDGLGHVADGMVIQNAAGGNLGLFAQLNGSTVRHLGVTNFNIQTNSQSGGASGNEYRVGGLAGNIGGAGIPVSTVTSIDGVWSSGVISTLQGSEQKFFFSGGLIGSQNGGFMDLTRSYSTANVSTDGSYTDNLATGGLIGDIGINTNLPNPHTQTTSATVDYSITQSYATGSIVQGDHGAYFGSGGLIGVIFTTGGELTDSYSWSNVVGSGSFGGIAGYALSGTYERNYTTESSVGAGSVGTASSYNGGTLPGATNNGTQLPSGWSSNVWVVGDRPILDDLPVPPTPLYVKVGIGSTSVYGDALGLSYTVVDTTGADVTFGSGAYSDLTGTVGTGVFTVGDNAHADSYNVSYLTGLNLTGGDADSFTLNPFSTAGSHTVTPRPLTVSLSNIGVTKVYDGNTSAPSGFSPTYDISNLIAGDTGATINHTGISYNDANVASANTLTISGQTIGSITGTNGSLVSDYSLQSSVGVAATITQQALSLTGVVFDNKVYDGSTTATVNSTGTLSGVIGGDDVSYTHASAIFADKNVGSGKSVSLSGISLSGTDAGNYSLPTGGLSGTADITPKAIVVSGITAGNKVYDGNDTASVDTSSANLSGLVAGDDVTVDVSTATFSDKNVGVSKSVALAGTGYAGADAGNYSFTDQTSTTADITPKPISVSGIVASDKVYDGNTTASVDVSGVTFTGIVAGDDLTASGTTGTFSDKNAATGKTVALAGTTYSGTDVGNYVLSDQTSTTAAITQKSVTVAGIAAVDKVYDGNTSATVDLSGTTFGGMVVGDDLAASGTVGTFSDKNVGTTKTVALAGTTYSGTDVNNYTYVDQATATAGISPLGLTISGLTAEDRVYDATTHAVLIGVPTVSPVAGDLVSLGGIAVGSFAGPDAGNAISVSVAGLRLSGVDASNYTLQLPSITANITPAPLIITANNDAKFVTHSDATGYAGVRYSGFIGGQDSSVLGGTLSVTRTSTSESAGNYAGVLQPSGLTSSNYNIQFATGDFEIVPADELLVRFGNSDSVYGNTPGYSFLSAQYMDDNNVIHSLTATSVNGNSYVFDDGSGGTTTFTMTELDPSLSTSGALQVGTYALTATGVTSNSSNFSNSIRTLGTHTVEPGPLTVVGAGLSKIYDGTTAMDNLTLNLNGEVAGDVLAIGGQGAFSDRHAGSGLGYRVNLELTGADAHNYFLSGGTTLDGSDGQIQARPIDVTAPTVTKPYDGTDTYVLTPGELSNLNDATMVGGDSLDEVFLRFEDADPGASKELIPWGVTITDGNGGTNYAVTYVSNFLSRILPPVDNREVAASAIRDTNTRYVGATQDDSSGFGVASTWSWFRNFQRVLSGAFQNWALDRSQLTPAEVEVSADDVFLRPHQPDK